MAAVPLYKRNVRLLNRAEGVQFTMGKFSLLFDPAGGTVTITTSPHSTIAASIHTPQAYQPATVSSLLDRLSGVQELLKILNEAKGSDEKVANLDAVLVNEKKVVTHAGPAPHGIVTAAVTSTPVLPVSPEKTKAADDPEEVASTLSALDASTVSEFSPSFSTDGTKV